MANIVGTEQGDHLTGGVDGDSIYGNGGNDTLSGAGGADYIYGGEGDDAIWGDAGDDYLQGDAGADTVHGGDGVDYLYGGSGADALFGDADGDDLSGEEGDDTLYGDSGNDYLQGNAGNDLLNGGTGENYLNGGDGIDTVRFAGPRADYVQQYTSIGSNQVVDVESATSIDHLVGVERLHYPDVDLAIDLSGHAGVVAKLIGAVLGPQFLAYAEYVGIGLFYLDQGVPQDTLVQAVIDARLGPQASNSALVDLMYSNLAGQAPSESQHDYFQAFLDTGEWTQVQLVGLAMQTSLNADNIDLNSLNANGIAYLPW
ncbi:hypothetical protein GHT07_14210 [Caenimonas koreensis DSM 17982]|uniref:Hemolysin-type calcium-binding repeat-containing protein n=1 Tax=Caenimonas koreensis DSM 17982 TaxID=1121255 RepID=A0A844BAE5_9BURK|nr:calcium-binding protein [Caenimonas koreensis]MRD48437.1 hypothetical protein [Caenimonas koreensis DSM 17982]